MGRTRKAPKIIKCQYCGLDGLTWAYRNTTSTNYALPGGKWILINSEENEHRCLTTKEKSILSTPETQKKSLVISDNGFLIHIDIYTHQVGNMFYPKMHRSGELPTFIPREQDQYGFAMSYESRCKGKNEAAWFPTEKEALEFAEKSVNNYFKKEA